MDLGLVTDPVGVGGEAFRWSVENFVIFFACWSCWFVFGFQKLSSLCHPLRSGDSNPKHFGRKPKHCILRYRTHADNRYINTATYNNYGIWEWKNILKWWRNKVFGHLIAINAFRGDLRLIWVALKWFLKICIRWFEPRTLARRSPIQSLTWLIVA